MTRSLFVFLFVLVLGGTAVAKPKIAVLGIEAQDQTSTQIGKDLTDQLRAQAKTGTGKYELAANSDKELVDEKMMGGCDSELPACMAPIGANIGAARLLYGHVRKVGNNFIVDLVLLNVDSKQREKAFANQRIDATDAADAVKLGTFAKNLYKSITSEASTGTLVIEVSNKDVDKGTVKIDGDEKGYLASGRLVVQNVSDQKHTLEIIVGGYQKFSKEVTVVANDRTPVQVTLTADPNAIDKHEQFGTVSQGGKTNYWKPLFIAGSVIAVAGASFWTYSFMKEGEGEQQITHYKDPMNEVNAGPNDCPSTGTDAGLRSIFPDDGDLTTTSDFDVAAGRSRDGLKKACKYRGWTKWGITGTSIGVVIMLGTFYSAWLKEDGETKASTTSGRRTHKSGIAVTPVITPNGGGAVLRLDW